MKPAASEPLDSIVYGLGWVLPKDQLNRTMYRVNIGKNFVEFIIPW